MLCYWGKNHDHYFPCRNTTNGLVLKLTQIFKPKKSRTPKMVFGKYITDDGYFYGDDALTRTIPIPDPSAKVL